MESPTRASLRSEYNHHHQPAQSSPLRAVFAPVVARTSVGSSGGARKINVKRASTRDQNMGTPFALTIPPLPPSSITASRSMKSTPRPRNDVNDENTPVACTLNTTRNDRQMTVTSAKRLNTIPAGDQTMFAPMLLSVGDQSLLMEQQLPTYKDLWNDSEDEGEDELSFMVDSMEQENGVYDGSVRSRGGNGVRKSILGQSTLQNHAPVPLSTTKASKGQTNSSRLASLYKPTPKPDTSSRRRSTLFARGYASGDKLVDVSDGMHDVMVPLYGASSPMAVGSESTPMALSRKEATEKQRIVQPTRGSDTEEDDGDGEVGITDEQIAERSDRQSGSQVFLSQASLASASQAIPEATAEATQPIRTATPTLTARRSSPVNLPSATPKSSMNTSKKRTPSQRPEGNLTPLRGSALTASARNSPNPRARKTARKSRAAKQTVENVVPSSPAIPLATETRRLTTTQPATPLKSKSRRRSTAAPGEKSTRRPRASKASHAASSQPPAKARRLSGRKSTGSIPSQKAPSTVKRTRHSLSAAAVAKGESPKGRRRRRQSLAPLELVERVGLLDIPQRPASPTEDPLLLIPSARKSVGSARGADVSSAVERQRDIAEETTSLTPRQISVPDAGPVATEVSDHQSDEEAKVDEPTQGPSTTPSSSHVLRQTSQPRALGSSPWVSANLSIFSPTAMASSPVRPSPVRWRIASPLPELPHAEISPEEARSEVAQVTEVAPEERSASRESTPRYHEESDEAQPISLTPTLVNEAEHEPLQDAAEFLPDTEWQAFERDDSPLSSHDGESGENSGERDAAVDSSNEPSVPDAIEPQESEPAPVDSLKDRPVPDTIEPQEGEPCADRELTEDVEPDASPIRTIVPVPTITETFSAIGLESDLSTNSTSSKKKVGRICLRLPLQPVIVKLEIETADETRQDSEAAISEVDVDRAEEPPAEKQSPLPVERDQSIEQSEQPSPPEEVQEEAIAAPETDEVATILASPQQDESVQRLRLAAHSSATLVPEAESPFQTRIEPTSASAGDVVVAAKRVFRESVSSVSVTSEDPRAAARAAALLKLHHRYLNEGPGSEPITITSIPTPQNIKISPRRRRISQYFQSAETASSLTLPELLQEAELELVDTTATTSVLQPLQDRPTPIYSPFPMPGSWSRVNNPVPPFQQGRVDYAQWTIEDWQDLERCYKRLYKKRVRTSSLDKYVWTFDDSTEVIDNLCKLKRIALGSLRDEWSSQTLRLRINTLHRKRKSNEESVDLPLIAASSRSPKRLKANDSSVVEDPVVTVPPAQKLKRLLSRGWRSVLQILEPPKRGESEESSNTAPTADSRIGDLRVRQTLPGAFNPATPMTATPIDTPVRVPAVAATPQPSEMRQVIARRASVLARAKELNNVIQATQGETVLPFQSQLTRSVSTPSTLRHVIPDASSKPIVSLPRRSLVSQEPSPSVKSMIKSFEKSFEEDESAHAGKNESSISHELRRLSSRRSVSGSSNLRRVLERSIGSANHDTP